MILYIFLNNLGSTASARDTWLFFAAWKLSADWYHWNHRRPLLLFSRRRVPEPTWRIPYTKDTEILVISYSIFIQLVDNYLVLNIRSVYIFRKLLFDPIEEDPNYNPLPEDRPGKINTFSLKGR